MSAETIFGLIMFSFMGACILGAAIAAAIEIYNGDQLCRMARETRRQRKRLAQRRMYTHKNFKTKKALKDAVLEYNTYLELTDADKAQRHAVTYYQPGPFGGNEPLNGTFCCEGPHYPEPHRWYATCTAKNGIIVKVK